MFLCDNRGKKSSLISGYWPGEIFLSLTHVVECLLEYIFLTLKKKQRKQKDEKKQ